MNRQKFQIFRWNFTKKIFHTSSVIQPIEYHGCFEFRYACNGDFKKISQKSVFSLIPAMEMKIIVFEEESYWRMQKEMMNLFAETLKRVKMEASQEEEWISEVEAKKVLGYRSKRKWQQLRDGDKIKYSKYGKVIKYSKKSLYEFINNNIK